MIIRKLAVPLINEKILQQAEHCYIATSAVSDAGFDFLRSRIPSRCKIDLVTGLDMPVSPAVLRRILNNYAERISVRVYNRNAFNANVYLIDLPFRKSVAFLGSGSLTMDGLKDAEELFWKVGNPKEIESLLSWFTGFYEFGTPLTMQLIDAYEPVYHAMVQQEVVSRRAKEFAMLARAVDWDGVKFRNQFFQREHYGALNATARSAIAVREKLQKLQEEVGDEIQRRKLYAVDPTLAEALAVRGKLSFPEAEWISFSRSSSGFTPGFMRIDVGLTEACFFFRLFIAGGDDAKGDRNKLQDRFADVNFLQSWFAAVTSANGYSLEVAGRRKPVDSFGRESALVEWLNHDSEHRHPIVLERRFLPGDPKIRIDNIRSTCLEELDRINSILSKAMD